MTKGVLFDMEICDLEDMNYLCFSNFDFFSNVRLDREPTVMCIKQKIC